MENQSPMGASPLKDVRREAFAIEYVRMGCRNAAGAWRKAVDDWRVLPSIATRNGKNWAEETEVAERVAYLHAQHMAAHAPNWTEYMADLDAMIRADVNEIVRTVTYACRHCHGVDHGYQWTDAMEHARAVSDAVMANRPAPEEQGGYGYTKRAVPHEDCPQCHGNGITQVLVSDTTRLSRGARMMLKGIKQKADGSIEVELHDHAKLRELVGRALKVFGGSLDKAAELDANRIVVENALTPGVK